MTEVPRRIAVRSLLALLGASAAVPGLWALLAPHSFYASFPGVAHWVDRLPPYNDHLTADVGAFYLVFALLMAWAGVTLARALVVPVCAAWMLFSALHLGWHVTHLDGFPVADAIGQTAGLAATLVAPAVVIWAMHAGSDRRG